MPEDTVGKIAGVAHHKLEDIVVTEQLRLLTRKRADLPINLVNAVIVTARFWSVYPSWLVVCWLTLFFAIILARYLIRRNYRITNPGPENVRKWARIFTMNAFATGCMWGITGSVILATPDPMQHLFVVFVLAGMMAGGIVTNASFLPAMLAFILPTILPLVVVLLTRADTTAIEMGVMLALFSGILAASGRGINLAIIENFRLRIDQESLTAKLRASEAAMAEAQETARIGSWDMDIRSGSIVWSAESYRIFGVSPDRFVPTLEAILARIHPDDRAATGNDLSKSIATGTASDTGVERRIVMDDGTIKHVQEFARLLMDAEGRPTRIGGTIQDITDRKKAESKLQFSNLLLTTEMEASPDGLLVVNENGHILSFNRRFVEIWKVPSADLAAENDDALLARVASAVKNPVEFKARVQFLVDHPGEDSREELETTDGRSIDRYSVTLKAPSGEYLGRTWFFRDITERRQAANALAYRDRLLHAVNVGTGYLVKAETLDLGLKEALRIMGECLRVDRVIVMQEGPNTNVPPTMRSFWQTPDIRKPFDFIAFSPSPEDGAALGAWRSRMRGGKVSIGQLTTSDGAVRQMLEFFGNQSTLLVPIFVGGAMWGSLGVDSCSTVREWTSSEIDTIKTFGDIAGSLLVHEETRQALQKSEQRFRVLSATSQDAIITIDSEGRIGSWNRGAERILGYSGEEAVGRPVHEFLAPERYLRQAFAGMATFVVTGKGDALGKTLELAAIRKDGTEIDIELSIAGANLGGKWEAIGILRDITERKNAEEKLQFANLLLETEMEASPDGILVVDPARRITSFNRRFADIWKVPLTLLRAGRDDVALTQAMTSVREPEKVAAQIERIYADPAKASHDELEMVDGRFIERHTVTLNTPAGEYLGRVWFFRDITEAKRAAAHALWMARFDGLTGLANRGVFVEALQSAVARARRGEKGFAVIYLDLDHFKDVNDTLGHPVGDALLQAVSARLRLNTRESDTVARFGGDEFAVVAADVAEPADAAILAEKLIEALGHPYSVLGNEIYSGASIGIDLYGPDALDAETLLSHADVALYRAKSEGRSRYRFFTDAMDAEVRMQVSLGTELHEALKTDQFFLLYQPQVAIDTGRITGVEALVRWRHPSRGILLPELFIPVAEKIGIIVKLGHWVLVRACRDAKARLDAGLDKSQGRGFQAVRTAVNLSALQFKSPTALEVDIAAVLAESGLPPGLLELELTETVLMEASQEQSNIVTRLRGIGVTIAIDDFGTGYSSLDYLRRFPADRIKIAQTFVRHLETMAGEAAIVKATIGLARELGIMVMAEGVESLRQAELLREWGCAEAQGYYFAPPLPQEELLAILLAGETLLPGAGDTEPIHTASAV